MKAYPVLLALLAAPLMAAEPSGQTPKPEVKVDVTVNAEVEVPFRFLGGDADRGKQSFIAMSCTQCHTVPGVELPRPDKVRLELSLAAEPRFVATYEDLILAITNPKHVVTERYKAILSQAEVRGEIEPFMPTFTDRMTVQQLIDIVAFLHERYSETHPKYEK